VNPFEILGLEPRLALDRDALNQAFRDAGKLAHPDAGGSEEGFAQLQAAVNVLSSPARRLGAWLESKGVEVECRGSIGSEMMDEFSRVGELSQKAETVIRKREAAQSALAKAILESETQLCREELEVAMSRLEGLIEGICSGFPGLEQSGCISDEAMQWHRDLTFLEKWRASLRALFARLL